TTTKPLSSTSLPGSSTGTSTVITPHTDTSTTPFSTPSTSVTAGIGTPSTIRTSTSTVRTTTSTPST
ncbi:hypothetical protein ACJMK2_022138, partial [Sinanodonta woodiana]